MATERQKGVKSAPRTELVTVRFDPETKFLMDLAARAQHRSLANFVEWAVEQSFEKVALHAEAGQAVTLAEVRQKLWDVEEADRLFNLGENFPHLLSHDQQRVWKLVCEVQVLQPLLEDIDPVSRAAIPVRQLERLRKHWQLFKQSAESGIPATSLVGAINVADHQPKD